MNPVLLAVPSEQAREAPKVAVRLAADHTRVPRGEPLPVTVTIENESDRPRPVLNVEVTNLVWRFAKPEVRNTAGRRLGDLFESSSSDHPVFTPWFKPCLSRPARVAVYDRTYKPVGEFVCLPPGA